MKLLFASEHRLECTPDGRHWSDASFVSGVGRYRHEDCCLTALVRVARVDTPTSGKSLVPPDVRIVDLPAYRGLTGTLRHTWTLRRRALGAAQSADRVVVRVPGVIGNRVGRAARTLQRRLLAEIVGDPAMVFSQRTSTYPARRMIRAVAVRQLRWVTAHADITCYVTERDLQEKYPPRPSAPTFAISNIRLAPADVLSAGRRSAPTNEITVVSIASMEQVYKRVDWTIRVAELVAAQGFEVRVIVIGDGDYRSHYESLAAASPIQCSFVGHLPRDQVFQHLDAADAYVSTSAVEGLPRAVLEAMARGVPTFAFAAGGTAQLLPGVQLRDVGDVEGMAADVVRTLTTASLLESASSQAVATAARYTTDALGDRTASMLALLRARPG